MVYDCCLLLWNKLLETCSKSMSSAATIPANSTTASPGMDGILLILLLLIIPVPAVAFTGFPPAQASYGNSLLASPLHPLAAASVTTAPVQPEKTPRLAENRAGIRIAEELSFLQQSARVRTAIAIALVLIVAAFVLYYLYSQRRAGRTPVAGSPHPVSRTTIAGTPAGGSRPHDLPEDPAFRFPPPLEKRYRSSEFIGEGGLARVFRAERVNDGKVVAVKVPIRYDEATGTHFIRDIAAWQGLSHPNIIGISAANILPIPYIEMEYAPNSLTTKKLPLSEADAIALIRGIANGVSFAHRQGIVHRDIKPDNILIADDGTPKITDWGLAKHIVDMRESMTVSFSPAYAAPEQLAPKRFGKPGAATDIYQIGVLLYEVLTGDLPFTQDTLPELNQAILYEEPPEPGFTGKFVPEIRQIIRRCMQKDPKDRYDSVDALIRDLDKLR